MASGERCQYTINVANLRDGFDLDIRDYSYGTLAPFEDLRTDSDGHWCCPRLATESDQRCVFHSEDEGVSDQIIANEIVRIITDGADRTNYYEDFSQEEVKEVSKRFVGVSASTLRLENIRLDAEDMYPIDLRCCEIDTIVLRGSTIGHDIKCDGGTIGNADLCGTHVDGNITVQISEISDGVDGRNAEIEGQFAGVDSVIGGGIDLQSATIGGGFDFSYCEIEGPIDAKKIQVHDEFRLKKTEIAGKLDCEGIELISNSVKKSISAYTLRSATVTDSVVLANGYIEGTCLFNELTVGATLDLESATIENHLWMGGVDNNIAELGPTEIGRSVNMTGVTIGGVFDCSAAENGQYRGAIVNGAIHASNASFGGRINIGPEFEHPDINALDLRGASIDSGTLCQPEDGYIVYDLTEATVGDITIEPINDDPTNHVRINRTAFDGFNFSDKRRLYSKIGWNFHELGSKYEGDIKRCYELLTAEQLAKDFAVLFEEIPPVAEAIATTDPPYDTGWLADLVFEKNHDLDHIRQHGPGNLFPSGISDQEAYRKGVVTMLAEYKSANNHNRTYMILENSESASMIRDLAELVLNHDKDISKNCGDYISKSLIELSLSISYKFAQETVSTGDASPYRPDIPNLEPTVSELEVTYQMARNGAEAVGDRIAVGEFLIKELEQRRKQHWQIVTDHRVPTRIRAKELYDWTSNALLYGTSGYGERPGRVFLVSLGIVFLFFAIYTVLPTVGISFAQDALLFSFQSFASFVVGQPPSETFVVRTLSAIQGFLGAFFIGLFVVALTRSIDR
jgi:hypothetical protein